MDAWLLQRHGSRQVEYRETDPILSWPRLWALLNHSEPLILMIHADGECAIRWPRTTHHVVYVDTWCERAHGEWLASQRAEDGATPGVWPTLRSFPFGTSYGGSSLDELGAERRPASERQLLFSFRGSVTYRKPSRKDLRDAMLRHADAFVELAERTMAHVAAHPSGVGRYLVEMKGDWMPLPFTAPYPSSGAISYLELLRASVFSISPPADLWESYRNYEAIEAGSIPVVADNESYHLCGRPALHMLETIPGVVAVGSWDELPRRLARLMSNLSEVDARQQAMLQWLDAEKATARRRVLATAAAMRARRWAPRTTCVATPLSPQQVAEQHRQMADYWRRPQRFVDNFWRGGGGKGFVTPDLSTPPFVGPRSWCERADETGSEDFTEDCFSETCMPPLIAAFTCGSVATSGCPV
eukprot:3725121-Prymnesium_polylepis.1